MPSEAWVVLGALVGAVAGSAGVYLSTKAENVRHRQRLAFEMGMREWERQMKTAVKLGRKSAIGPAVSFAHFYARILSALDAGKLPKELPQIIEERNELLLILHNAPRVDLYTGKREKGPSPEADESGDAPE